MLFKTFAQKLFMSIGCEDSQADFVFNILSSVISDKYSEKDEIITRYLRNGGRMLRYYFEGTKSISNIARKIIRYVDASNFENLYSDMFKDQHELIRNVVDEFSKDIPEINDENYALKLGKLLVQILFEASKQGMDIDDSEYNKLRHSLYVEADGICPITGYELKISGNEAFKIVKIHKDLPFNFDNTVAISPLASPTYFYINSDRHSAELQKIKEALYEKQRIKNILDDSFYSIKLKNVVDKLTTNPTILKIDLKLKPTEAKNKINPEEMICSKIYPLITDYYLYLRDIFKSKDGVDLNFNDLCKTIRNNYLKLSKENLSHEKIFDLLSENLARKTKSSILPCEIIVSFFIQNCEVFDEIPK